MIIPTVGRVVWFWPALKDENEPKAERPFAALVAYVWGERMVNLAVFDHNGKHESHTSVPLMQDEDRPPHLGYFASWMPYQIGQAKKYEALEKEVKGDTQS